MFVQVDSAAKKVKRALEQNQKEKTKIMKVTRNKVTSKISTMMSVIQSSPYNLQASKIITIKQLGVKPSDYSFSFPLTSNRQVTSGLR